MFQTGVIRDYTLIDAMKKLLEVLKYPLDSGTISPVAHKEAVVSVLQHRNPRGADPYWPSAILGFFDSFDGDRNRYRQCDGMAVVTKLPKLEVIAYAHSVAIQKQKEYRPSGEWRK